MTKERRYSVAEIDALRHALEQRWLFGTTDLPHSGVISRQFFGSEKDVAVESLVRTHMYAGHTAKDIYDADKPKLAQVNAEREPHEPRTEEDKKEDDMDRQRAYPERRS